jgi:hypothetical protein
LIVEFCLVWVGHGRNHCLHRVTTAFTRADADRFVNCRDENLSITNPACLCRILNGVNYPFGHGIVNNDLDFDLWQEINNIFSTAIKLGVAFLATKSLGLKNGDSLNSNIMQSFFHFIQFEGFDNGFNFFHNLSLFC